MTNNQFLNARNVQPHKYLPSKFVRFMVCMWQVKVRNWVRMFNEGQEYVHNNEHNNKEHLSLINKDLLYNVEEEIHSDRQSRMADIAIFWYLKIIVTWNCNWTRTLQKIVFKMGTKNVISCSKQDDWELFRIFAEFWWGRKLFLKWIVTGDKTESYYLTPQNK